jgi:hypothetical protein
MRASNVLIAVTLALGSTGCLMTRWTDRYFLGTTGGDPVYEGRIATGIVLAPVAIAVDVVTFPVQAVVLVFAGDDALRPSPPRKRGIGLTVKARSLAQLEIIHEQTTRSRDAPSLYGLDDSGNLIPLGLDQARAAELVARMQAPR